MGRPRRRPGPAADRVVGTALRQPGHSDLLVRGARAPAGTAARATIDLELPVEHGIWIAARCEAGPGQVAHTTPVYVTVGGGGFENRETLQQNIEIADGYLKEVEQELAHPGSTLDSQAVRHRTELERQIAEARARLRTIGK